MGSLLRRTPTNWAPDPAVDLLRPQGGNPVDSCKNCLGGRGACCPLRLRGTAACGGVPGAEVHCGEEYVGVVAEGAAP